MNLWRNSGLVKVTLFFFTVMLLYNPATAEQISVNYFPGIDDEQDRFPVTYVDESDVSQLIWELQRKGYVVRQGTLAQLERLVQSGGAATTLSDLANKPAEEEEENKSETQPEQQDQEPGVASETEPGPEPEPSQESTQPPPQPAPPVNATIGVHADVSYGSSGHSGDAAKVFFLVAGVVVVAAFIVYAGKYIADIVRNEDYTLWWEVVFNSTFLSADSGQHGEFFGAKIATGFVSNELFQLALVGEVGNANIDLALNRNTNPQVLDYTATYWLLGGAARLHLTDAMVNASYLYMELMGGTTNQRSTGTISVARAGASFGIGDTLRLGASYGAQYIGLNEDEGFTNDDDNYWFTLGVEIGARF